MAHRHRNCHYGGQGLTDILSYQNDKQCHYPASKSSGLSSRGAHTHRNCHYGGQGLTDILSYQNDKQCHYPASKSSGLSSRGAHTHRNCHYGGPGPVLSDLPTFCLIRTTHSVITPPVNPAGYLPEGLIHIETVTTVAQDQSCQTYRHSVLSERQTVSLPRQ